MELKNLILGFDFGENYSQLCCYDRNVRDAVSLPEKAGSDVMLIPTKLGKALDHEEWQAGSDARKFAGDQNGVLLDRIYEICIGANPCMVEQREYTPGELLGIFLREVLKKAGIDHPELQIAGIMITTKRLTRPFVENVRYAYSLLGIPRGRAYLQEYDESFYYHTMYQKPELWSRKVALFHFEGDEVAFSSLSISRKTKPASVTVKRGARVHLGRKPMDRDRDFGHLISEVTGTEIYSSAYLVGDGFDQSWAGNSLKLLAKNQRHIFGGNNLFAKGACYGAREKVEERMLKGYLFLGNDLVRSNIGMDMIINGSPAYYPLITSGVNWYEAEKECELILDETDELVFVVSSMEEGKTNRYTMKLSGLPKRPRKTTRIHLKLEYDSPVTCQITAEDLGFGEMFPATHKVWHETMGEA